MTRPDVGGLSSFYFGGSFHIYFFKRKTVQIKSRQVVGHKIGRLIEEEKRHDSISGVYYNVRWFITAVCESCLEERLEEERRSQLVYSRAAIYVRQVDKIGITDILMDVAPSTPAEDPDFQVG